MLSTLLALTIGCGGEPPAEPPEPTPEPRPQVERWRLAGLESNDPAYAQDFEGLESGMLPGSCSGTCIVELWRPIAEQELGDLTALFVRAGDRTQLIMGEQVVPAETRWTLLGSVLGPCVGDPLALPPAEDPEGFRHLERRGDALRWVLHFSGNNACHLEGELELPLRNARVDTGGLLVDGEPWDGRGHQLAQDHRRAWLRLLVREKWPELEAADKILAMQGLAGDPDPEAAVLLHAITERDPSSDADARQALEQRAARFPEPAP